MKRISITYDGKVGATSYSVHMGDYSIERIISKALEIGDNEYRDINAEVEIYIRCKPSDPMVNIEDWNDDEC